MNTLWLLAMAQGWRGDHMDWGWGGWLFMSLMMAAFWAAVIVLAFVLIRSSTHRGQGDSHGPVRDPAFQIARERFARGEITDEEYERIKRGLS